MAQENSHPDRYHAQMPAIPGVPSGKRGGSAGLGSMLSRVLIAIFAVLLFAALALAVRRHMLAAAAPKPAAALQPQDLPDSVTSVAPPKLPAPTADATTAIASLAELAKPWSSRAFTFVRPLTHENISAMVVRLPGATAASSGSYWAFSLTEPFGTCQLQFVTNLATLANQYGYAAKHPMVVDPCTQTVFDPLRMGQRSDGAWVRGQIVQGGGLRPPMAIEVAVRGTSVYADRME
ncbi:MAG: hypothetical protein WA871_04815 [Candidatus Acidiferrales bacterium]